MPPAVVGVDGVDAAAVAVEVPAVVSEAVAVPAVAVSVPGVGVAPVAPVAPVASAVPVPDPTARDARIARACAIAESSSVIAVRIVAASGETVGESIAVPAGDRKWWTSAALRSSGAFEPSTSTIAHSTCRGSTAGCEWALAAARASSWIRSR